MASRVYFDGVSEYSFPGGSISGTVTLEADTELRGTDFTLTLRGQEYSRITDTHSTVQGETYPFLQLKSSFRDRLIQPDAKHIAPGTYPCPFRFELPTSVEPSLATSTLPAHRGHSPLEPPGMYVEFLLEARVEVGFGVPPFDRWAVPVFSTRRVLGAIPELVLPESNDRPWFRVQFENPPVVPGTEVTASYFVGNPGGRNLRELRIRLYRHVEHRARTLQIVREGPVVELNIPLDGRQPAYSDRLRLSLPDSADMTGPYRGELYRTWWIAEVRLVEPLAKDAVLQAAFTPI